MAIITISRQFASGGGDIAALVARDLGWTLVDRQLIDRVAERLGWSPEDVAALEERTESLIERLARTLSVAEPETFFAAAEQHPDLTTPEEEIHRITQSVLEEVTAEGNVVVVGRGGQAFLGDREDVLHVFVVAPREDRIRRAAERLGLSAKDAERRVDTTDHQRQEYIKTRYGRPWGDPVDYHLVLNTGWWSPDRCARAVAAIARDLFS